jgi:hypothetical protein
MDLKVRPSQIILWTPNPLTSVLEIEPTKEADRNSREEAR